MADRYRRLGLVDSLLIRFEQGLRVLDGQSREGSRVSPADAASEGSMTSTQRRHVASLMRVNHAGEIAAQALYHGQALTARGTGLRATLECAADEENDHLDWCRRRVDELGGRTSRLDPLWYAGSFVVGAVAGLAGDRSSLGFLAETERQVVRHLDGHIAELPRADDKTRAVLSQMRDDERRHATTAIEAGAAELAPPVKRVMKFAAALMTRTAYWI